MKLERDRYAEAEPLLRDGLDAYAKANSGAWRRYLTQNLLGASLAGQGKYEEAEPLLVSGWEGIKQRSETIPWEDRSAFERAGQRIVQLYQDWGNLRRSPSGGTSCSNASPPALKNPKDYGVHRAVAARVLD